MYRLIPIYPTAEALFYQLLRDHPAVDLLIKISDMQTVR